MREGRFPCRVVRMTHITEATAPAYFTPAFFEGEGYDELMDMLEAVGVDAAIQHAAGWDYGNDNDDSYRDTVSEFGHEVEYGPVAVMPYSRTCYYLVASRSAAYAYLVRDAQ